MIPERRAQSKPFCYIDVDLTLVDVDCKIYPEARAQLDRLRQKYTLVCWSKGGKEYAEYVLKKNNVEGYFDFILSKPYMIIDDDLPHLMDCRKVEITSKSSWKHLWSLVFGKPVFDPLLTAAGSIKFEDLDDLVKSMQSGAIKCRVEEIPADPEAE